MLTLFTNSEGDVPKLDDINDGITLVPTTVGGEPGFRVYLGGTYMETVATPGYGPTPLPWHTPSPVRATVAPVAPDAPPTWKVHVTHGPGAGLRFTVTPTPGMAPPYSGLRALVRHYTEQGSGVEVYSPDGERRPLMED